MGSPSFATHFARLLSQRIREPDNVDAHNLTLGELAAANAGAVSLGKIGTLEAVEHLVHIAEPDKAIFRKKPTSLRVAAVIALAESNSSTALAAVRRFVNDPAAEVRAAATKSLTPARSSEGLSKPGGW